MITFLVLDGLVGLRALIVELNTFVPHHDMHVVYMLLSRLRCRSCACVCVFLDLCAKQLDAGHMSFERTGLALQNPDIQRAVTKALSVVPRDEGLIAMPRASRWINIAKV